MHLVKCTTCKTPSRPLTPSATISTATLSRTGTKRGVVPKRRFQKGRFEVVNNMAYTLFYEDCPQPNGSIISRRARRTLGRIGVKGMSQRSALREHNTFMETVNRK